MKTSKLFITTLAAVAAMSLNAYAEDVTLTDGQNQNIRNTGTGGGNTYVVPDSTTIDSGRGAWIHWHTDDTDGSGSAAPTSGLALGTSDASTSLSGSGFLGLVYHGGNAGPTYSVNLQNTDATNFSGQLTVLNSWNSPTNVILSGASWSNTEYVSAWVSRETGKNWLWSRGNGQNPANMENDTLTLAGGTTLAGIRGASKGLSSGAVTDVNAREFVAAQSSGTTLTLDGAGTYAFYGTVGTAANRLSVAKTGTGTQTFGGTSYLDSVSVSEGTLSLDGTVNLSRAIEVTGNGAVTVANSVVFGLANLTANDDGSYQLISSSSSLGENFMGLTLANVDITGTSIAGRNATATFSKNVSVSVVGTAGDIVWNGSSGNSTWNSTAENWTINGSDATRFYKSDNVTFGDAAVKTVTLGDGSSLAVGTMTVSAGDYILAPGAGKSATISGATLSVESGASLSLSGELSSAATSNLRLGFEDISLAGTLKVCTNATDSWSKLTFNGGTLHLHDIGGDNSTTGLSISTVDMASSGSVTADWNGKVSIEKLTGSGDLTFNSPTRANQQLTFALGNLEDYSETINMRQGGTSPLIVSVDANNLGTTANFDVGAGTTFELDASSVSGDLSLDGRITSAASAILKIKGNAYEPHVRGWSYGCV